EKNSDKDPEEEELPRTPGAILRVELDDRHPLTAGYGKSVPVLVYSHRQMVSEDTDGRKRWVAGRFSGKGKIRIGGFLWPESRDALSGGAWLVEEAVDSGRVVLFAEDPNFRL